MARRISAGFPDNRPYQNPRPTYKAGQYSTWSNEYIQSRIDYCNRELGYVEDRKTHLEGLRDELTKELRKRK
ncbi:hypothetical protein QJV43_gp60 [Serratia phage Serbin]|uniref:Uncharacterized protein n=1 Tax=Serratia phage Serbin TaxID=2562181 RepID=A0A482MHF5_9CAUD|nr:hypothetical protein QJV43_gp60 [Serratia phage Serbin]QBQ72976.1 hypothetical protein CPT_Serbin_060 [Serratia phage Serbin]